nr:multicopper oxidase [uncultured bacterium]
MDVRLEVGYCDKKIGRIVKDGCTKAWDRVQLRTYNGELQGPVIKARAGDTLNITLDNKLPPDPNPGSDNPNIPHGFNITNLHFHGLHVSPAGNADNVNIAVGPGQRFHYEVKVPSDHPAGTYWYHPHKHGSVALQLGSGMAGALIIRGDIDEVPAIEDAEEKLLIFQQFAYAVGPDGIGRLESYQHIPFPAWLSLGRRICINGELEPTFRLCPGEVQRWRLINADFSEGVNLKLVKRDPRTRAEVPLTQYQIALDGITTGFLEGVTMTELHPGYRVDLLVRAADNEGRPLPEGVYWLVDDDSEPERRDLARIVVKGRRVRHALPTERELRPLAPFKPIEDHELTGTQEAIYDIDFSKTPPQFRVNGRPYDPHARPRQLKVDTAERWLVSSPPSPVSAAHSFHIHVNPFQLTRPDGRVIWKDTIFMPAGVTLELRTRYKRYIGTFVHHCHVVDHGDLGMMESLEIIPPRMAHEHPPH